MAKDDKAMKSGRNYIVGFIVLINLLPLSAVPFFAQEKKESSYSPVIEEPFEKVLARD